MSEVQRSVRLRRTLPRVPVVLTAREVLAILDRLSGRNRLAAEPAALPDSPAAAVREISCRTSTEVTAESLRSRDSCHW